MALSASSYIIGIAIICLERENPWKKWFLLRMAKSQEGVKWYEKALKGVKNPVKVIKARRRSWLMA